MPTLLAVVLVVAPQAGGAVYRWSALALGGLVLALTVLALARSSVRQNARVDGACLLLIVMAAWTLFQLIPLPPLLVRLLSPNGYRLYVEAAILPRAISRTFIPLTLDQSVTAIEALKWACYGAVYAVILNWSRGAGTQLASILLASSLLTAVVCLVMSLFRIPGILGVYQPVGVGMSLLRGPFVNPGHSGILCALLGTLCLGIAAESSSRLRIWIRVLALTLLVLALVPQLWKSAIAAVLGPSAYLFWRSRAKNLPYTRRPVILTGAALLVVGALVLWWRLPSLEEIHAMPNRYLAYRRYSRLITWSDAMRLLADYPWVGVGRGAFGVVFTAYDSISRDVVAWHAENVPLQMAAEWGILPTLAFLVAAVIGVVKGARAARKPLSCAAAAGLLMLAVVNVVDFNLELFAMGLIAIACAGILARRETPRVRSRGGWLAVCVPGALIVFALVSVVAVGPTSRQDAARIDEVARGVPNRDALDTAGSAAARRHPADFFLPQLVASHHLRAGTSLGLVWLNRTLYLRPFSLEGHYLTGIALQRAGRYRQAVTEYAAASRDSYKFVRQVGDLILRNPHLRQAALLDLSWARSEDLSLLEYLGGMLAAPAFSQEQLQVDERILQMSPPDLSALAVIRRQRSRALHDEQILKRLDAAISLPARVSSQPLLLMVAEIREKVGRVREAEELLRRAALLPTSSREAATALVRLHLLRGEMGEAAREVDELQRQDHLAAGDAEFLRGVIQERVGNLDAAHASYLLSAQYRSDDLEALVATALTAQQLSREQVARNYAGRALEVARGNPDVRTQLSPVLGP